MQTEIKRAHWRSLVRSLGNPASVTLADGLAAYQEAALSGVRNGRLVVSTSGNGHSVSLLMPASWMQLTQESFIALTEEFQTAYDRVSAFLTTPATLTPADADISAEVLTNYLVDVCESLGDHTALRIQAGVLV